LMQSQVIKKYQIWLNSTGAKTAEGKAKSSRNAYKGGLRPMMLQIARVLREHQNVIEKGGNKTLLPPSNSRWNAGCENN
jgi:hypothetical protein